MELLQLKYFLDSAKTENFAKVAEKYMVPASSVSASVRRLEKELGCMLFDRMSNKIFLNENGRKFQQTVRGILDRLETAKTELQNINVEQTQIRILVRSMRQSVIKFIIDYQKQNPNTLFKTDFDMVTVRLEDYDIIVDAYDDKYSDYEKMELCSIKLRIQASADSHLCDRLLTLSELKNQKFITFGEESSMYKIFVRACKKAGFIPQIAIETNDALCYTQCVVSNAGIALTRQTADSEKVKILQVVDFDERQTIYVFTKNQAQNPHIQGFVNYLKSNI